MADKKKKKKQKHYWWRFLLVFIGGMLTTLLLEIAVPAVALAVVPASTVVTMFNQDPNEILGEDYADQTLLQIVFSIIGDAQSGQITTIGGVAKYSPKVTQIIQDLDEKYIQEYLGFSLNMEELYAQQFENLGTYLLDEVQTKTQLAAVIGATGTEIDPMLHAILYYTDEETGEEKALAIGDLVEEGGMQKVLNRIALADVMGITYETDDAILKALCFYEDENHEIVKTTIGDLMGEGGLSGLLDKISVADLMGVTYDTADDLTKSLLFDDEHNPLKISDLMNEGFAGLIDKITLASVLGVEPTTDNEVMKALCFADDGQGGLVARTIGDIKNDGFDSVLHSIPLTAIITDTSNDIVKFLVYPKTGTGEFDYDNPRTIGDLMGDGGLSDIIDTATLGDVIDIPAGSVLENYKDTLIKELGDIDISDLTIEEAIGAGNIEDGTLLDKIRDKKISELSSFIQDEATIGDLFDTTGNKLLTALAGYKLNELDTAVQEVKIGDLFDTSGSSKMLQAIQNYSISELTDETINNLAIADLFDTTGNALLQALADAGATVGNVGTKVKTLTLDQLVGPIDPANKILYALRNATLDNVGDAVQDLTVGTLIDVGTNKLLNAMKDWKLSEIATNIETLTIGDIIPDCSGNPILQAIAGSTLSTVNDDINALPLSTFITIDDDTPYVIANLKDTPLSGLSAALNGLTLSSVFSPDDIANNRFLRSVPGDTPLNDIPNAINNLRVVDIFSDVVYNTPNDPTSGIKAQWKYLLTPENLSAATDANVNMDYTIDNFGDLITNFTWHMKNETVRTLHTDELITLSDSSILERVVPTKPLSGEPVIYEGKTLSGMKFGDLTVTEFIYATSALIS